MFWTMRSMEGAVRDAAAFAAVTPASTCSSTNYRIALELAAS
jgi:hypothetical protein